MSTTSDPLPTVLSLDEGFADPDTHRPSLVAVFRQADGARVELAVRDAVDAYVCEGPRIERHQLVVSTPGLYRPSVMLVQIDDLRKIEGVPEVLVALERFAAGDLRDAARYVAVAGRQWEPLIDLLGGPAR